MYSNDSGLWFVKAIKIGNQRVFNDDGRNNEGAGTYYSNGMAIKYERTPDEKITIVGPLSVPVEGQVRANLHILK